jgi:catechol 2,3-dioxygenase-like lactoylglutathione lyase family enzyme
MISHVYIGVGDFDRAFAYFRDPDGNKLCVCCHQPEPQ